MTTRSLALLFALSLYGPQAAVGQEAGPSFIAESVTGACRGCGAHFDLGQFDFVSPLEGWAVGEQLSLNGNGGVSTVLRTTDGGTTWRRLSWLSQQGSEAGPTFSFVDRDHGWVSWIDQSAIHRLSYTTNGGRSWQKLENPPGQRFVALRFFDVNNGVSIGVRLSANPFFGSTNDGGHNWQIKELPIANVDETRFVNREVGWVVGSVTETHRGKLGVLRTIDGGTNWTLSFVADASYEFARDFYWTDESNAWLITWLANRGGSYLYLTHDGGLTWQKHPNEAFQGKQKYLKVIRFITKQIGYAFFDDAETNRHYILSTVDGGQSWERTASKESVSSCDVISRGLWCSAGMNLLKIRTNERERSGGSP